MASGLPLLLRSTVTAPSSSLPEFVAESRNGTITIRGHLCTGSRGWALRAEAARRRSVISVHVTAIQIESAQVPDLEQHEYEANVQIRRPGRYSIRVRHAFVGRGEPGVGLPRPVFETVLKVP